ncbi:hypothetical protein ACZ87_01213, partial [Candidatus Erwinia dacicola]
GRLDLNLHHLDGLDRPQRGSPSLYYLRHILNVLPE